MKALLISLCVAIFSFTALARPSSPSIWGQVVKTKKEVYGHEYFVTFKENGKDYAYPLAKDSKVGADKLENMVGKYARINGKAEFEKTEVGESKYIMTFQVQDINPLSFKDLNENMPGYSDRLTVKRYVGEGGYKSEVYTSGIDNKTANTAILVGGAALAVDVLANILRASAN